ncbi:MAG: cell division protein SepF [Clostridiaceae bacterium]|jgi:FtsZ-interacting cell division protein YlmF|nr:cell division protein SepF [Clostridia bacterium]NMA35547.1 cell division protein SepF [Clostridiaceae bacterium]
MSSFLNKLFGSPEDSYDELEDNLDYYPQHQSFPEEPQRTSRESRTKRLQQDRTVQFPTPKQGTDHTVVLVEAFDIDTAWPVCDHVKQGRTVICNTERLSPDIRVRFQDIVSGSAYAIGGLLQAVSQFIFVFAPASTRIDFDDGRLAFSTLRDVARGAHASNVTSERDLSRHTR